MTTEAKYKRKALTNYLNEIQIANVFSFKNLKLFQIAKKTGKAQRGSELAHAHLTHYPPIFAKISRFYARSSSL
ncbi:hypothetical protein BpHYR1_034468 [Brachionus plicatilis]|uniref:Uncharacterized protein n=1 Tax=Brachionus plicatilis TaxID=10195 RepID=A0A3M7Q967_BRAPC|nr:hypothetical protein BpHYR1_034468 [Brachionus plicatilis]